MQIFPSSGTKLPLKLKKQMVIFPPVEGGIDDTMYIDHVDIVYMSKEDAIEHLFDKCHEISKKKT